MDICFQLGQKYLWADIPCLIQDDEEDKRDQMETMKSIYTSACAVLIAAYGDSMDFGISGVRSPGKIA